MMNSYGCEEQKKNRNTDIGHVNKLQYFYPQCCTVHGNAYDQNNLKILDRSLKLCD